MKKLNFQIITKDFNLDEEKKYLENLAGAAAESCADVIQLRNKKISGRDIYHSALFLKKLLRGFNKTNKPALVINDRPDIAYAAGADGVHLGQDDFPAGAAKNIFPGLILGVSVENASQAILAENSGADYLGLGPVFRTKSKIDAGDLLKPEEIISVCNAVDIPVIAIGGIKASGIKKLAPSGIAGAAVIGAVSDSKNPAKTALLFRKNIDAYLIKSRCA